MGFEGYIQSLIVIFLILGFLLIVLWAVKKYGIRLGLAKMGTDKDLVLENHISLGPKRDACVVRYKNKKYILGVTDHQINLIAEIEDNNHEGGSNA